MIPTLHSFSRKERVRSCTHITRLLKLAMEFVLQFFSLSSHPFCRQPLNTPSLQRAVVYLLLYTRAAIIPICALYRRRWPSRSEGPMAGTAHDLLNGRTLTEEVVEARTKELFSNLNSWQCGLLGQSKGNVLGKRCSRKVIHMTHLHATEVFW